MKKNAFALAMVLWISAILMASTIYLISMYKKSVDNAKGLNDKLIAELKADSNIEKLKFYALTGKFQKNYINNNFFNFPTKLYLNNKNQYIDNNITFNLEAPGSMLSIYSTNSEIINKIVQSSTNTKIKYKDTYSDWIDLDSVTSLNGAENGFYSVSSLYKCSNIGVIQHPEELFLIKYFDELNNNQKRKIIHFFHYGIYSHLNPNTITQEFASSIMQLNEFDINELKALYNKDYTRYKNKLYLLLQKNGYTDAITSSSMSLYGTITVLYKNTLVKKEFNIMFKPAYNQPYTVYKNTLYTD